MQYVLTHLLRADRLYAGGAVRAAMQVASEMRQDFHALLALLGGTSHLPGGSAGSPATGSPNHPAAAKQGLGPRAPGIAAAGAGAASAAPGVSVPAAVATPSNVVLGVSQMDLESLAASPLFAALSLDTTPEYEAAWTAVGAAARGQLPALHALAKRCLAQGLSKQGRCVPVRLPCLERHHCVPSQLTAMQPHHANALLVATNH